MIGVPWPVVLLIVFFLISAITSIWFTVSGSTDGDKAKVKSGFAAVFSLNFIMTLLMFITAMYYVAGVPDMERPYVMLMTHIAILLSITALSVTTFRQLDSAVAITSAAGGCPSPD